MTLNDLVGVGVTLTPRVNPEHRSSPFGGSQATAALDDTVTTQTNSRGARQRYGVLGASVLLCITGCMSGPNFQAPAVLTTATFTSAPLAELQQGGLQLDSSQAEPAQWWTLLSSPQLDQLIKQALRANRSVAAARATLAQAQALDVVSESSLYPSASLSAGAGRQKYGAAFLGPSKIPPFTYYSIGPAISYTFDFSGGIRRSIEQQHAQTLYEQHELDASALAVSGNIALQAVAAAAARAQIDNLLALLEDDRKDMQLVQGAFDAGSGTRVDVLTAQSQLANDETLLPPLRRDLSVATHALALLVGEAPADWSPPTFKLEDFRLPANLPLSVPSELAHRRPDILAAEAQVRAATAAIGVATANLYPQISLSANIGLQATTLHNLFESSSSAWSLAGSLMQPLYNHGALRARQRATMEAMQASLANYQQVLLSSFAQVADALEALDHDQELLESEQGAVTVAGENLELTRKSYGAGNTGVLQVLEAQRQNQQARLGLVRGQSQRLQDTVQLLLALGGQVQGT